MVLLLEASGDFVAVPLCSGPLTGEGAGAPVSCNALGYGLHLGLQAGSVGILQPKTFRPNRREMD